MDVDAADAAVAKPSIVSSSSSASSAASPLSSTGSTAAAFSLVQQGAEARLFRTTFCGHPCIVKERFSKAYRHPQLDIKITRQRLRQEASNALKALRAGVSVPAVYYVDLIQSRSFQEEIIGHTVKSVLWANALSATQIELLCAHIGAAVARIHDADLIHGDLTTSNLMLRASTSASSASSVSTTVGGAGTVDCDALVVIDWGLSYQGALAEDRAVDLYVMERALLSTHPQSEPLVDAIIQAYGKASQRCAEAVRRLSDVRARGRKKLAFG